MRIVNAFTALAASWVALFMILLIIESNSRRINVGDLVWTTASVWFFVAVLPTGVYLLRYWASLGPDQDSRNPPV
jgi:Kef-type K+ transport system membrane component KefB